MRLAPSGHALLLIAVLIVAPLGSPATFTFTTFLCKCLKLFVKFFLTGSFKCIFRIIFAVIFFHILIQECSHYFSVFFGKFTTLLNNQFVLFFSINPETAVRHLFGMIIGYNISIHYFFISKHTISWKSLAP